MEIGTDPDLAFPAYPQPYMNGSYPFFGDASR